MKVPVRVRIPARVRYLRLRYQLGLGQVRKVPARVRIGQEGTI